MAESTTVWQPDAPLKDDWYDPHNWTAGVPDASKIAIVDTLATRGKNVVVKGLRVQGNGQVSLEGLTAQEVVIAGKGLLVVDDMTVTQELTLSGGGLTAFKAAVVPAGSILRVEGPGDKDVNGLLRLHGTGIWRSDGRLILSNAGLDVDGVLRIDSDATLFHPSGVRLRPSGRIVVANGKRLKLDGPSLNAAGSIELANSTLDLRDGDHVFSPGAKVAGSGIVQLASGTCHTHGYIAGCSTTGTGALLLDPGVTLRLAPGDDPKVDHLLQGPLQLTAGRLEFRVSTLHGTFDIGPNAQFLVTGDAPKHINGRLRLRGRGILNSAGRLALSNEGLEVSGVLEIQADSTLYYPSSLTVKKTGRVKLGAGRRLTLDGPSLTLSGLLELTGSTVDLRDGEHVFSPGAKVAGSGAIHLRPGTCHAEGYNVGCTLTCGGGLDLAPAVTLTIHPPQAGQGVIVYGPLQLSHGRVEWTGGSLAGDFDLGQDTQLSISGTTARDLNGLLRLGGKSQLACRGLIGLSGQGLQIDGHLLVTAPATLTGAATVLNTGELEMQAPLALRGPVLRSSGTVNAGRYRLQLSGGPHVFGAAGTLRLAVPDAESAKSAPVSAGDCVLGGTLALSAGFQPADGQAIRVVSYTTRQGKFATVEGCPWYWQADYGASLLTVRPSHPPVPYVIGSPGEPARSAFKRMSNADPRAQKRRVAACVKAYGFDPVKGLRGPSIRDPRLGLTVDDLEAAFKAARTLGVDPAGVLAVWTSEGRYDFRLPIHGGWLLLDHRLTAGEQALSAGKLHAYGRSEILYRVFGCDPMVSYTEVPKADNQVRGPAADHETPFRQRVQDMHAAGLALPGVADPAYLARYFRDNALRMKVGTDGKVTLAFARCSLASWLALQVALFDLQRRATEALFNSHYREKVDLSGRPWVTYLVWNSGSTWSPNHRGAAAFRKYLTVDDRNRPYPNARAAIAARFGDASTPPTRLSPANLRLYYQDGKEQSRSALANSVVVKYLAESYASWLHG